MNNLISFFAALLCVALCYTATTEIPKSEYEKAEKDFGGFNFTAVTSSKRLVQNYVDCLVNGKPCTSEGTKLRKFLPDAIATSCSKCSKNQRDITIDIIATIKDKYPDQWKRVTDKWDPNGKLIEAFAKNFPDLHKKLFP